MKFILSILLLIYAQNALAFFTCFDLNGAAVFSQEDEPVYLGFLGNDFAAGSINNEFGSYGSEFSSSSIRNAFSPYGNDFSQFSSNNPLALKPPILIKNNRVIGYLSNNQTLPLNFPLAILDDECDFFQSSRSDIRPFFEFGKFDISVAGSWFNPDRDGEGFLLDLVISNNSTAFIVYFFTFDNSGNQMYLVGVDPSYNPYTGVITANVNRNSGASFGNDFDANDVTREQWGTIEIEFIDCTTAIARWFPVVEGFQNGSSQIQKPLANAGVRCP
jgi:hypothetical protein